MKMDNKLDGQLLIIKYLIDSNKQDAGDKMKKHYSYFYEIKTLLKQMMV